MLQVHTWERVLFSVAKMIILEYVPHSSSAITPNITMKVCGFLDGSRLRFVYSQARIPV
jgi:hypothetical protein